LSERRRGALQLVVCAALFSTGGAAIKACTLSGWQVAGLRSAVAALAVFGLLPQSRRVRDGRIVLIAAAYAATLVLFVRATKLTTAASAIFLQSVAPMYVLVLAHLLLGERIRRRDLGFMAAFAAGLVLLLSGSAVPLATAPDPALGNRLAAASGITYALTLVGFRWVRDDPAAGPSALGMGNVFAALAALPFAWPLPHVGAADLAVVVYLGVVQIGLAYLLLIRGMRHVPALEASLLLLVEPVLNPLWAWLLQKEVPEAASIVGGAVILITTAVMTSRGGKVSSQERNARGHDHRSGEGDARGGGDGGGRPL
jgi:drug/metabolite transporter (DMT)-like permease